MCDVGRDGDHWLRCLGLLGLLLTLGLLAKEGICERECRERERERESECECE